MTPISKITVWENSRRIGVLNEFLKTYDNYLCGAEYGRMSEEPEETSEAQNARSKLNRMTEEVSKALRATGYPPVIHWSPPPMIGGQSVNIDLILNLFRLHRYQISSQEVFDAVERAGGVYEANHSSALRRTYNPFFWIGRLISAIGSIPFAFMGSLGFNRVSIESSFVGKILKGLFELTAFSASILTVLQITNTLDPLLKWLHIK